MLDEETVLENHWDLLDEKLRSHFGDTLGIVALQTEQTCFQFPSGGKPETPPRKLLGHIY